MVGLLRSGFVRRHVVPALAVLALAITAGLGVWQWGVNTEIVERSLAIDDLTLTLMMVFCGGGIAAVLLSWRSRAVVEAGEGEYYALLLSSILGMVVLVAARTWSRCSSASSCFDPALRAVRDAHAARGVAGVGAEVPDRRLGRLGDAALRAGAALRGDGHDRLRRHRRGGDLRDCCSYTGIALVVAGLAFKASVAPFHQWTPDVYEGAPTAITGVHGGGHQGGGLRRDAAAVRRRADRLGADLGPAAGRARADHDRGRQRGRDRAVVAQADAGLLVDRAGRLHARRRRWSRRGSACRRRSST